MRKTKKVRVAVDPLESLTPEEAGELLAGDEEGKISEVKFGTEPIWDVDAIKKAEDEFKEKLLKSPYGGFTATSTSSGPFRASHVFEDDLEVKGELKGPTIEELKDGLHQATVAITILKAELDQLKKKQGFHKIPKDI